LIQVGAEVFSVRGTQNWLPLMDKKDLFMPLRISLMDMENKRKIDKELHL